MQKIHIIGGPGSGKTTLAHKLSERLNIPNYDLDLLGQKNGTNPDAHVEDAFMIARQPGWVAEGIYVVTIEPQLQAADIIVLLEIPWPIAAWRIVKRHVVKTLNGTNIYGGLKPLIDFLGYAQT